MEICVRGHPGGLPGGGFRGSLQRLVARKAPQSTQDAPKEPPKSAHDRPRAAQEPPKSVQEPPKNAQGPPRNAKRAAKSAPERAKSGFKGAWRRCLQHGSKNGQKIVEKHGKEDEPNLVFACGLAVFHGCFREWPRN